MDEQVPRSSPPFSCWSSHRTLCSPACRPRWCRTSQRRPWPARQSGSCRSSWTPKQGNNNYYNVLYYVLHCWLFSPWIFTERVVGELKNLIKTFPLLLIKLNCLNKTWQQTLKMLVKHFHFSCFFYISEWAVFGCGVTAAGASTLGSDTNNWTIMLTFIFTLSGIRNKNS